MISVKYEKPVDFREKPVDFHIGWFSQNYWIQSIFALDFFYWFSISAGSTIDREGLEPVLPPPYGLRI